MCLKEELLNAIESEIYSPLPTQLQMANKCEVITVSFAIDFAEWLREECYSIHHKWLYKETDDLYSIEEIMVIFKEKGYGNERT